LPQTNGPLRAYTSDDVFLLLKSSDVIQHDLDPLRAYASGSDDGNEGENREVGDRIKVELVLKAFVEINPAREFRCFVRDNVLVGACGSNYTAYCLGSYIAFQGCRWQRVANIKGVSQRDTNYYEHLQSSSTKETICDAIRDFWEDELMDLLPDTVGRNCTSSPHPHPSNLTIIYY
jgi:hypothetical protein